MGVVCHIVDAILFVFFLIIAIVAPLLDAQSVLSKDLFPRVVVELGDWYAREYGDHLVVEKPHFFVGLVWLELVFQWPLSIINLYAILAAKSWFPTTCLLYGVSLLTAMVAILAELIGSGKASDQLLMVYYPFFGFGVLAILRSLFSCSSKTKSSTGGKGPSLGRKKRA